VTEEKEIYSLCEPFRKGITVQGLMELWLSSARKKMMPQGYANYQRIVRRHILPELGDTVVDRPTSTTS